MLDHIQISKTDCGAAILVGDPARVSFICQLFGYERLLTSARGLLIAETRIGEWPILVACTGIGGPSCAIVIEELAMLGISMMVRLGTCGALSPSLSPGDIVVSTAAVRDEGTSRQYVSQIYPAVACVELCTNVITALQNTHHRVVAGITHSKDAYYLEKAALQPNAGQNEAGIQWEVWREAGVLVTDMETSTLYVLGGLRGIQVVSTLVVVGEDKSDARISKGLTDACKAIGAVLSKMRAQNSGNTTTRSASSLLDQIGTD